MVYRVNSGLSEYKEKLWLKKYDQKIKKISKLLRKHIKYKFVSYLIADFS